MRPALFATAALVASSLLACSDGPVADASDPEDAIAVDDSKADNYFSASAQEYVLEGRTSVTLDPAMATASAAARMAAAKKLISEKQIATAWFVTQYLVDKEEEDANHAFGGFGGMAKGGMWSDLGVTERADKITYDFTFKQIAAGGKNLLSKLPIKTVGGKQQFDLEVGKPTNAELGMLETNDEWYRQAPWDGWDPATVPADKKETLTFTVSKEKASSDAFYDMKKMTADGKLDIDVYFGWDYHSDYHLKHSKQFFTWLKDQGFKAPSTSWDTLTRTSGAFTRKVTADGKDVAVEVRIFVGKPGGDSDPDTAAGGKQLEDDVRVSLKTRDVVVYSGHSGPFYGFALANWKKTDEGDLDDADIRSMDLADKYQVVLAEGCDTYQIGEAFLENPAKAGKNINVITTTSFSNASTPAAVEDFLSALLARDSLQRLRPQSQLNLLTKLDSESAYYGFHTMYGIHGIDEDPKLHPFAKASKMGTSCSANADCGGPGNLCVSMTGGKKCTAACAGDGGGACGAAVSGWSCKSVASSSSSTIFGRACAR
ncbi:MAG: hypothetical protein NT062_19455 [Proteobacteria bacterium]|nr:hypothetical protein [Pseudomonadota bacterium]